MNVLPAEILKRRTGCNFEQKVWNEEFVPRYCKDALMMMRGRVAKMNVETAFYIVLPVMVDIPMRLSFQLGNFRKKCTEQRISLYHVLVDSTKSFDTVMWEAMWEIIINLVFLMGLCLYYISFGL